MQQALEQVLQQESFKLTKLLTDVLCVYIVIQCEKVDKPQCNYKEKVM